MLRTLLIAILLLSRGAWAAACPISVNACSWTKGQPGDILVTLPGSGRVAGLNGATGTWYLFGQASTGSIDGIVIDAANPNKVQIMQEASGAVQTLDGSGASLGLYGTSSSTKSKMGAFNPNDGSLWVPMQDPSKIYRFPAGGGTGVQIVTSGATLYYPSGMAFDHAGNLYISNAGLDQILKISASQLGNPNPQATVLSSGVANALGLVYDGDHSLYSAGWLPSSPSNSCQIWRTDTISGAATMIASNFAPLAENAGGPLYQCDGITMDLQGHLWVVQFMNPGTHRGLLELDTNGTPLSYHELPAVIDGVSMSGSGIDAVAVMGLAYPRPNACVDSQLSLNCPSATATPTPSPAYSPTATLTPSFTPGSTSPQGCIFSSGAADGMYTAPQSTCACWLDTATGAQWEGPNPGAVSTCYGCSFDLEKFIYIPAGTTLANVKVNIIVTADDHFQVYANGGMISSCFNPGGFSPCAQQNQFQVPTANLQIGWNSIRFHIIDEWQGWHALSYSICWDLTGLATPTPTRSPTPAMTATFTPTLSPSFTPGSTAPQGCIVSSGAPDGMYTAPQSTCACWLDTATGAQWEGPNPGAVSSCYGCAFDLEKFLYIPAGTTLSNVKVNIIVTADDHFQVYANGGMISTCTNPGGMSPCAQQNQFQVPTANLQIGWNSIRFHITDAWQGWHALSYSICWDLTGLASPTPTRTATSPATPTVTPTQTPDWHKKAKLQLKGNYHRGHHPVQDITISTPAEGQATLIVLRPDGRLVTTIWTGSMQPGEPKDLTWNLTDSSNNPVESGVYYVVFKDAAGSVQKQKLMVVR